MKLHTSTIHCNIVLHSIIVFIQKSYTWRPVRRPVSITVLISCECFSHPYYMSTHFRCLTVHICSLLYADLLSLCQTHLWSTSITPQREKCINMTLNYNPTLRQVNLGQIYVKNSTNHISYILFISPYLFKNGFAVIHFQKHLAVNRKQC